jgi:hypothetical protein
MKCPSRSGGMNCVLNNGISENPIKINVKVNNVITVDLFSIKYNSEIYLFFMKAIIGDSDDLKFNLPRRR